MLGLARHNMDPYLPQDIGAITLMPGMLHVTQSMRK